MLASCVSCRLMAKTFSSYLPSLLFARVSFTVHMLVTCRSFCRLWLRCLSVRLLRHLQRPVPLR